MGGIIKHAVKTLYQGVSRQPDSVRLTGQVEDAENSVFSVVTGGFSKRPGTVPLGSIPDITSNSNVCHYSYERDSVERYHVFVTNGAIFVYDANNGTQKTVTYEAGSTTYLASTDPHSQFSLTTIADYTVISNSAVTVKMDTAFTPGTVTGSKPKFSDLPTSGSAGQIYRITGDATELDDYYVKWNTPTSSWTETVDPTITNSFDAATMPHVLIRNADGTFTFKKATWEPRKVGNKDTVPEPDFVGRAVLDVAFFRDRLVIASTEVAYLSQSGDYFNFWPDKSTDTLDSDPFGRIMTGSSSSGTGSVTIVRHITPFRKNLFINTDQGQFELTTSDILTPKKAVVDLATTYMSEPNCRPVTLGDELYFPCSSSTDSMLLEYYYDQDSLTNTATNVTAHVLGYVPSKLRKMVSDTFTNQVFCLSDNDRGSIYIYRVYWENNSKAQSAWSKFTFGQNVVIHGLAVFATKLHIIITRGGTTYIETLELSLTNKDTIEPFPYRIDRKIKLKGTYNTSDGYTYWTLTYPHNNNAVGILSNEFPGQIARLLMLKYDGTNVVKAMGDFSSGYTYFGVDYDGWVRLSKQYLRDQEGKTETSGRLQLRRLMFDYEDTGFFQVWFTPKYRDTYVSTFNGRILGDASNKLGETPIIDTGTFPVKALGRGDTSTIEIHNNTFIPNTITGVSWIGFYNSISESG